MTKNNFTMDDFTHEAQMRIISTQDELDASDTRHLVSHIGHLDLPLKENNDSYPLVKNAVFVVNENISGKRTYVFSHTEAVEET